jgi:TfoX/Sxy family transcriptional regulator of competence genes
MAWVKIPKENHPRFEAALPLDDRIELKAMFGGLAAMLNGYMMSGLWAGTAIVRLAPDDYAALLARGGEPFDPWGKGRPMESQAVLPESEFRDPARLAAWLARARDHVASLPPHKNVAKKAASRIAAPKKTTTKAAAPKKTVAKKPARATPKKASKRR